jgi:hypothetical protein
VADVEGVLHGGVVQNVDVPFGPFICFVGPEKLSIVNSTKSLCKICVINASYLCHQCVKLIVKD